MTITITRHQVADDHRSNITADFFGSYFPRRIEPLIFALAEEMGHEYRGGLWQFYRLSNGAFYMAPDFYGNFTVSCENGFKGAMSADALGITACLYAYSRLSFGDGDCAEICAQQYHWLREYMLEHAEAREILAAID